MKVTNRYSKACQLQERSLIDCGCYAAAGLQIAVRRAQHRNDRDRWASITTASSRTCSTSPWAAAFSTNRASARWRGRRAASSRSASAPAATCRTIRQTCAASKPSIRTPTSTASRDRASPRPSIAVDFHHLNAEHLPFSWRELRHRGLHADAVLDSRRRACARRGASRAEARRAVPVPRTRAVAGCRRRRWQHRLNPLQQRIGGGCHLTRDTVAAGAAVGPATARCRTLLPAPRPARSPAT